MGKTYDDTRAKFEESQIWVRIDPDTGEQIGTPEEVNVLVKKLRRGGFAITYLAELVKMIDTLGNKKMKVVKYILENMDGSNKLCETTREISEHCGVSRSIVIETLGLLDEVGFIARKTGVVMLSPKIVHKGNAKRERYLLEKFIEIQDAGLKDSTD